MFYLITAQNTIPTTEEEILAIFKSDCKENALEQWNETIDEWMKKEQWFVHEIKFYL